MLNAIAHHLRTTYGYNILETHFTQLLITQEIEFKQRAAKIDLYGNDLKLELFHSNSSCLCTLELNDPDCLATVEHYLEQHFHD